MPQFFFPDLDEELTYDLSPALLGVRNLVPPAEIGQTEMPDAQDRLASNDGVNRPRPGFDQFAALEAGVTRVNGAQHVTGSTFLVAYSIGATPKFASVIAGVATILGGGPAFDTTKTVNMCMGQNNVYFAWGAGLWKWDTTVFTNISMVPAIILTTTTANFTQPAVASSVSVTVGSTSGYSPNQTIHIGGAGFYLVGSITDATHFVVYNLGTTGNQTPTTVISAGRFVNTGTAPISTNNGAITSLYGAAASNFLITSTLTAAFTQPAVGATVQVTVTNVNDIHFNFYVYVDNMGYYKVIAAPDATHIILQNVGGTGNVAAGTVSNTNYQLFNSVNPLSGQLTNPNVNFPRYFTNRVIVAQAGGNTLYFSNFLDDSTWDIINLAVQLDAVTNDFIIGMHPFRQASMCVFRNSGMFLVDCSPSVLNTAGTPNLANTSINQISDTIGGCANQAISTNGNDIFFLSESGRGVYTVQQTYISPYFQIVQPPVSQAIQGTIDNIDWTNVSRAVLTVWENILLLSVPTYTFDSQGNKVHSTVPNAIFAHCLSLNTWQGQWNGYLADIMIRQETGSIQVEWIILTQDGRMLKSYHTADRIYLQTVAGNLATGVPYSSSITSKAYRFGETWNLVQPYNFVTEFVDSNAIVSVSLIHDNVVESNVQSINTSLAVLTIPIPQLPFDLDAIGISKFAVSARRVGLTNEIQCMISGSGQWSMVRVSTAAWTSRTVPNT